MKFFEFVRMEQTAEIILRFGIMPIIAHAVSAINTKISYNKSVCFVEW